MSLHKFYFDSILLAQTNKWRYGQAVFNHLAEVRPDIAEIVRGTCADPFHLTGPAQNEEQWDRFIAIVEANWNFENEV